MNYSRKIITGVLLVALAVFGFFYHKRITYKNGVTQLSVVVAPKTILAFLGAPGSGKGTLAKQAVNQLTFVAVSTGDLCRAEVASGSEKGKTIAEYMKGGLVPDAIMTDMLDGWLSKNAGQEPVILDGYPRTKDQAEKLNTMLKQKFSDYTFGVVYLLISDEEEVVQRIASRLVCEQCKAVTNLTQLKDPNALVCAACGGKLIRRDDDKEEIVRERLKTFVKNNDEIITYYKSAGIVVQELNVSHSTPEQIFENFKQLLTVYTEKPVEPAEQQESVAEVAK
jgi:adenylate kinase